MIYSILVTNFENYKFIMNILRKNHYRWKGGSRLNSVSYEKEIINRLIIYPDKKELQYSITSRADKTHKIINIIDFFTNNIKL